MMIEINYFMNLLLGGLVVGFIYALTALGITIIYGILQIPDFSHGNRYMIGAYAGFLAASVAGSMLEISYVAAILGAVAVSSVIAVLSYLFVYKRLLSAPHITSFIAAIGLLMLLEGFALAVFGPRYQRIHTPFDYMVVIGALRINAQRLIVLFCSIAAIASLLYFLRRTVTGIALEAVAQSPIGAKLVGINTDKMTLIAFAIAGALAGFAAALIAPITLVYPIMGAELNLKAFVICVVGGLGNIPGAIAGGLVLGIVESLYGGYFDIRWKNLVAFGILVAILILKPEGLFGKKERRA
ncbi:MULTISPECIES: branched-chain amino acid ABC transporter permease [Archaeoglobus]|jgi:branched-chain amino acid transport system permease protein|uniref:Branched-chain amino acid ABC transporter, permease protein (BraD-2) n=3 Tax=Archaeoglobus fulgidus TaxID=2234 RepID=O29433_ARCFU|nr:MULTISPECIES: branched-chain amino acid ABC transporter permease [Archaeoglobus]AAB90410.1 branched-chain amino acid ABC transporter, permease protein (braD-2) [Archaeoglobus fulgidus DSM 4304]AIG97703.1 Branched-chain amino acid ABC-type transport system, permease component [Archaeoglobus fulgidus DSM 8774]KUJ92991.1 MAG: Branched-chain amino acid ABC transporter, permease protein (BraD-2) [Archaeoglobus fulgidus]KUK06514.1 MAG: Branched-chain amino acid ABC transporter, permease protein (B